MQTDAEAKELREKRTKRLLLGRKGSGTTSSQKSGALEEAEEASTTDPRLEIQWHLKVTNATELRTWCEFGFWGSKLGEWGLISRRRWFQVDAGCIRWWADKEQADADEEPRAIIRIAGVRRRSSSSKEIEITGRLQKQFRVTPDDDAMAERLLLVAGKVANEADGADPDGRGKDEQYFCEWLLRNQQAHTRMVVGKAESGGQVEVHEGGLLLRVAAGCAATARAEIMLPEATASQFAFGWAKETTDQGHETQKNEEGQTEAMAAPPILLQLQQLTQQIPTFQQLQQQIPVPKATGEKTEKKTWAALLKLHDSEKDDEQLRRVLAATRGAIAERRTPLGLKQQDQLLGVVVTSFRKAFPNAQHELLRAVDERLSDYVHYQSGFENTLFGWTSSGGSEWSMEEDGGTAVGYKELDMRHYWYIEWLQVVLTCEECGGCLLVFDLSGDAAPSTSPNCAMELGFLHEIFTIGRAGMTVIVLRDEDLANDEETTAAMLQRKTREQEQEKQLFHEAYERVKRVLRRNESVKQLLETWIADFERAGGSASLLKKAEWGLFGAGLLAAGAVAEGAHEVVTAVLS